MNSSIVTLICGLPETQAVDHLNQFKCSWRIMMRDGETVQDLTPDRNDKRYNLVIKDGLVERVLFG